MFPRSSHFGKVQFFHPPTDFSISTKADDFTSPTRGGVYPGYSWYDTFETRKQRNWDDEKEWKKGREERGRKTGEGWGGLERQ